MICPHAFSLTHLLLCILYNWDSDGFACLVVTYERIYFAFSALPFPVNLRYISPTSRLDLLPVSFYVDTYFLNL
ncbi:hypothetical protein EV426DRAFT_624383, partial [Tirmania nivea]